jgi:hypothetical protein
MLAALDSPQMYRLYQEGSQYVHGSLYAISSYSKHLGNERIVGDFTSIVDWILPLRLCWLSLREATRLILDRLDVPERVKPNWTILNKNAEAAFQALISSAERSHGHGAEREAKSGDCEQ